MPGRITGSFAPAGRAAAAAPGGRHPVVRLFRLWRLYAWMDLMWATRSLKMALCYFVSDLLINAAAVAGVLLLAERFGGIGRWTKPEVVFLLGYAMLVGGVLDLFFGYNILSISRRIGRGQLDHTLIQPQPFILALLTEGFVPISGSPAFLAGAGLLAWSLRGLSLHVTAGWLTAGFVNLAASCLVVLAFSFLWGSLAFWEPRAAEEINSSTVHLLGQLKSFPLDGLGPAAVLGMMTVVPVGFVAWYPCRVLLGLGASPWEEAVTPLAALVFCLLAAGAFRLGMNHYGSTGSPRYHDLGHRR